MATPTTLTEVSQNLHLTVKRAQIATIVFPYLPDSEALNECNESAHANPIGEDFSLLSADICPCIVQAKVVVKPPAEVENDYRLKSPFTPLSLAPHPHLGSLGRIRRIQGTCSTRSIAPLWLACYLVPSYGSCGMACAFLMSFWQSLQRHRRNLRYIVSSIFQRGHSYSC